MYPGAINLKFSFCVAKCSLIIHDISRWKYEHVTDGLDGASLPLSLHVRWIIYSRFSWSAREPLRCAAQQRGANEIAVVAGGSKGKIRWIH